MKAVRHPDLFVSGQSLGASFNSPVMDVEMMDLSAIQINYTGAPVGDFNLQGSVDWDDRAQTGNWVNLPVVINGSTTTNISIPGSTSPILIDIDGTAIPKLRISYTRTSGTGSADIYTCGKRLGD